jgi:hypothetical protein
MMAGATTHEEPMFSVAMLLILPYLPSPSSAGSLRAATTPSSASGDPVTAVVHGRKIVSLRMSPGLHVSRGVEVWSAKVCVRWPPCKLREELLGWERRRLTVMHAAVSRSWKVGIALSTAGGRRLGHGRSRHSCHLEDEHHEIVI